MVTQQLNGPPPGAAGSGADVVYAGGIPVTNAVGARHHRRRERLQRVVDLGGGVTLATASPLASVRDDDRDDAQPAVGRRAGARRARRRAGVVARRAGAAAGARRHVAGRRDRVALVARAGARPGVTRRDRRAGDDDERDAQPPGVGVDDESPSRVGRVARAAHADRRDASRARGRPPDARPGLGGDGSRAGRRARPAAGPRRRSAAARPRRRAGVRPRARSRSPTSSDDVAARTRRVPVDVTIGAGVDPVVGDAAALGRALDHLVANAARHAATAVRVAVSGRPATTSVSTSTTTGRASRRSGGPRWCKRFVRLDEGRGARRRRRRARARRDGRCRCRPRRTPRHQRSADRWRPPQPRAAERRGWCACDVTGWVRATCKRAELLRAGKRSPDPGRCRPS